MEQEHSHSQQVQSGVKVQIPLYNVDELSAFLQRLRPEGIDCWDVLSQQRLFMPNASAYKWLYEQGQYDTRIVLYSKWYNTMQGSAWKNERVMFANTLICIPPPNNFKFTVREW